VVDKKNKILVKSTLNSDHVIILATDSGKKLFMIVNPAQNLISYKVAITKNDKEGICSIKDLDRAIKFYNKVK
jgi:hypothetical protein